MAGSSLLVLLDDIATVLDDVAVMTKVAARKTAGVLGDDLALNAEQVSGIRAERELPVVWAVAKGSFKNKLILVPSALAISVTIPWLIIPLLMMGGLYLCYEGFEKVAHKLLHPNEDDSENRKKRAEAISGADTEIDLVAFEKEKIKGAIRTDFILSAEIIVISLGVVANSPFSTQVAVVCVIALAMTIGVYGLVAGIVKLDDAGLALLRKSVEEGDRPLMRALGRGLIRVSPLLMKFLTIVGTAAMFLVGGGIIAHGIPWLVEWLHAGERIVNSMGDVSVWILPVFPILYNGLVGIIAGGLAVLVSLPIKKLLPNSETNSH